MSQDVQSLIWKVAPQRGNKLLLFLALGDWANDAGEGWAIVKALAAKSRQSERSVRYAIAELKRGKWITWGDHDGGRVSNRIGFSITLQKLQGLAANPAKSGKKNPAKNDTLLNSINTKHLKSDIAAEPPKIPHLVLSRNERERRANLIQATKRGLRDYSLHPRESWETETA